MDLKGIMLNEISQTEKDKYCMISHMWNLKNKKKKTQKSKSHRYREQISGCQRQKGGGWEKWAKGSYTY